MRVLGDFIEKGDGVAFSVPVAKATVILQCCSVEARLPKEARSKS